MKNRILLTFLFALLSLSVSLQAQNATDDVNEVITIAAARVDANNDLVPDLVGQEVTIQGIVMSPNYQTTNHSYYIQDETAGITTFFAGSTEPELNLGDEVEVTGTIGHYNGLTQLQPADGDAFTVLSTGNDPYEPAVMTIAEFLANPEMYESVLVGFKSVSLTGGTWPASGSTTLTIADASGSMDLRIDSDMDISGQPEPTWPIDVVGLGSQFDSSSPYDGGYQLMSRYYADDFLPEGTLGGGSNEVITIAEARVDADNDLIPDLLGNEVTIQGLVMSPNYQTTNHSYYIQDATGGITTFFAGSTEPVLNLGDEVEVTGTIGQYNGLTQLQPADGDAFTVLSTGNEPYEPVVMTIDEFLTNPEMYEGMLIGIQYVSLTSGTWPTSGSTTLTISDGSGEIAVRIDSDMDISGQPEPSWPIDIVGVLTQFDNSAPYDGSYQLQPRYYDDDFLPEGSLPVELTSFTASVVNGSVILNWSTATEVNNRGFEVERKSESAWVSLGFVNGNGTSTNINNYSFTDQTASLNGTVEYRLKQVDYDGTVAYSSVIAVEVTAMPSDFNLAQNYPNPFNPSTVITFSIPENGMAIMKVYDVLGKEVATLVNEVKDAGTYQVNFNASNLSSGIYYYSINFNGNVKTNKMMLVK